MNRYFRVCVLLILTLNISVGAVNTVYGNEISKNEVPILLQEETTEILGDLIIALDEVDYSAYLKLFHTRSPIYLMHHSELKDTLDILSAYQLSYEIENITLIDKINESVKIEVDLAIQSNENDHYNNIIKLLLMEKDEEFKIYDMIVKDIESLDEEAKKNIVLCKKRLYHDNGILAYEGDMKKGLPDGEGIRYYSNGNIMYQGSFKEGDMTGKGILYDEIGHKVYEGEMKNNLPNGEGIAFYLSGRVFYTGYWKNGTFDKRGKLKYENGRVMFMGEFAYGRANGKGKGYYENGILCYEGDMKDDCSHGKGIEYYETGEIMYEGEFAYGVPHGLGTKYDKEGTIIHKGFWEDGLVVID